LPPEELLGGKIALIPLLGVNISFSHRNVALTLKPSMEIFLQRGIILKEDVTLKERALSLGEDPRLNEDYCITYFGKIPEISQNGKHLN